MAFGTITVIRQRGTPQPPPYHGIDWSDPDELDIDDCLFDPGGSTAIDQATRQAIVTQPTVYAPHSADVQAKDRIVARDITWSVDGDPAEWGESDDELGGLVVRLKAVTGNG